MQAVPEPHALPATALGVQVATVVKLLRDSHTSMLGLCQLRALGACSNYGGTSLPERAGVDGAVVIIRHGGNHLLLSLRVVTSGGNVCLCVCVLVQTSLELEELVRVTSCAVSLAYLQLLPVLLRANVLGELIAVLGIVRAKAQLARLQWLCLGVHCGHEAVGKFCQVWIATCAEQQGV